MGRYKKVHAFADLPLAERQKWVNEFVHFAEVRMSLLRKRRYHRLVVRYVWRRLNSGASYVTADEVNRWIRAVHSRNRTREKKGLRDSEIEGQGQDTDQGSKT